MFSNITLTKIRTNACDLPVADTHLFRHSAAMMPDRHEWLQAENARIEREGTGSTYVRHALAEHAKRMLGFSIIALPAVYLIEIFSRRMDGVSQAGPLLAAGVAITGIGLSIWKWTKPHATIWRWATLTLTGVGLLFCIALLVI